MMEISDIVSAIEKKYILKLLAQGKRIDGRRFMEYRDIKVTTNLVPKAEGSADVYLGDTRVMCGIKYEVGKPFEDSPDEGVATCMAEFFPFASPTFESGPPTIEAIECARVVDRGIRHGNCIDYKKLCIKEGEWVYIIFIDIYVLDHCGNLIDASALAAISALLSAKVPTAKLKDDGEGVEWAGGFMPLPINEIPLQITFAKIGKYVVVDPSIAEEMVMDGRLSIAVNESGNICSMQKGGGAVWTQEEIIKYSRLAIEKANEIRSKIDFRSFIPKI